MRNHGRPRRHALIQELIGRSPVRSQEELRTLLAEKGIDVTQATLSRDIHELGLVKTPFGYRLAGAVVPIANGQRLPRLVREFVLAETAARNLVVLKTPPGGAQPVGLALDQDPPKDVVGTVAGDDTVLVITRSDASARALVRSLRAWRSGR